MYTYMYVSLVLLCIMYYVLCIMFNIIVIIIIMSDTSIPPTPPEVEQAMRAFDIYIYIYDNINV